MANKKYNEYSHDALRFLTQGVMQVVDSWELTPTEIITLLGLSAMGQIWLRKSHRRFNRSSPLSVMLNDVSPNGLLKIRMEVDCNYAYAISEAMRDQS